MHCGDSRQIEILRVACITAMMWVHVSPGLSAPSAVTIGAYSFIGDFLGNTLGRISVSLLSFVSGYLLWHRAISRPFLVLARERFKSIAVPMLVWGAIFILLVETKFHVLGLPSRSLTRIEGDPWSLLNAWTGLFAPTANLSLFFLRDLFVAALIVRAIAPMVDRAPLVAALLAFAISSTDLLVPLIFRASILQFVVLGAVSARLGLTFAALSRPTVALPIGALLTSAGYLLAEPHSVPIVSALDIPLLFRRLGLCFLMLASSAVVLRLFPNTALIQMGRHSFLAYLMHVPLIGVLSVAWGLRIGDIEDPSYIVFYLGAPFLVMSVTAIGGRILDASPDALQTALRGKTRAAQPAVIA